MRKTIGLATSSSLPDLHHDDHFLTRAIEEAGAEWRPVVWTELEQPETDATVIRSCWDYHRMRGDFLKWLGSRADQGSVLNPRETVEWNSDKRYLMDLADRGVPVVPTAYVDSENSLVALAEEHGWDRGLVVKPAVSASGENTWRATAGEPVSESRFKDALANSPQLVQPFVREILSEGEWSLILIGGELTHAVLKTARPGEFRVQDDHGGSVTPVLDPPADLVEAARQVVANLELEWLYARVDGCRTSAGFVVMELEMVEPELFLRFSNTAARRMVEGILATL